jgi:hypothetical protein
MINFLQHEENTGRIKEAIAWPDKGILSDCNFSFCNVCIRYRNNAIVHQDLSDLAEMVKWAQRLGSVWDPKKHPEGYGNWQPGSDRIVWKPKSFFVWCKKTKCGLKKDKNRFYFSTLPVSPYSSQFLIHGEQESQENKPRWINTDPLQTCKEDGDSVWSDNLNFSNKVSEINFWAGDDEEGEEGGILNEDNKHYFLQ